MMINELKSGAWSLEEVEMIDQNQILRAEPAGAGQGPRDGGAWWAAVYGVAQSRTHLK